MFVRSFCVVYTSTVAIVVFKSAKYNNGPRNRVIWFSKLIDVNYNFCLFVTEYWAAYTQEVYYPRMYPYGSEYGHEEFNEPGDSWLDSGVHFTVPYAGKHFTGACVCLQNLPKLRNIHFLRVLLYMYTYIHIHAVYKD